MLSLAARESESGVDDALRVLLDHDTTLDVAGVEALLGSQQTIATPTAIVVGQIDPGIYDRLLDSSDQSIARLKSQDVQLVELRIKEGGADANDRQ